MTKTKTSADYQRAFRARKAEQGLTEVRGIFARPVQHRAIKAYAKQLAREIDAWSELTYEELADCGLLSEINP